MTGAALPLWAEITIAALVLAGAAIALVGSWGLLRLKTYFERVHAPSIIATMGCWCIMHGTIVYFSLQGQGLALRLLGPRIQVRSARVSSLSGVISSP